MLYSLFNNVMEVLKRLVFRNAGGGLCMGTNCSHNAMFFVIVPYRYKIARNKATSYQPGTCRIHLGAVREIPGRMLRNLFLKNSARAGPTRGQVVTMAM